MSAGKQETYLLGTNVVLPLGLMKQDSGAKLRGGEPSPTTMVDQDARVQLLEATHIPICCATKVSNPRRGTQAMVFKPDISWIAESRVQMEDTLLEPDENGRVSVVIHNPTSVPLRLTVDWQIGEVLICLGPDTEEEDLGTSDKASTVQVNAVWCGESEAEESVSQQARKIKLGAMLDIGEERLRCCRYECACCRHTTSSQ